MKLLGVRIDEVDKSAALECVSDFLSSDSQHTVFTPNAEMLVAAHSDPYFQTILNESALNICDSRGVELALKLTNNSSKLERIPGIDFMLDICRLAAREGKGVYLLGSGDQNVIKSSSIALQAEFPSLKIAGYHPGPQITINKQQLTINCNTDENDAIVHEIIMRSPDILLVAFGHEKQEKWIYEHLPQLPSVKIAMGVGGAFDVLGGKKKRAPIWMRRLGLEWLWRLILEPRRLKRIWTAVLVFPYLVIKSSKTA